MAESPRMIEFAPGITVLPDSKEVQFSGEVCLTTGWLEVAVCSRGTREHESLVVTDVAPSLVHAGLLLLDLEPGEPGRWAVDGSALVLTPPSGPAIEVLVRYRDGGEETERKIADWICDDSGKPTFGGEAWIFGGSVMIGDSDESRYAADISGNIVGIVTFGDELLGRREVLSDQADISPPEWMACGERIPPMGTPVTVILRPRIR